MGGTDAVGGNFDTVPLIRQRLPISTYEALRARSKINGAAVRVDLDVKSKFWQVFHQQTPQKQTLVQFAAKVCNPPMMFFAASAEFNKAAIDAETSFSKRFFE